MHWSGPRPQAELQTWKDQIHQPTKDLYHHCSLLNNFFLPQPNLPSSFPPPYSTSPHLLTSLPTWPGELKTLSWPFYYLLFINYLLKTLALILLQKGRIQMHPSISSNQAAVTTHYIFTTSSWTTITGSTTHKQLTIYLSSQL